MALDDLLDHLTDLHSYAFELVQGPRGKVLPDTVIARLASSLEESKKDASVEQTIHQLVLLLIALFAPTTPGSLSGGVLSFATNPGQIERFLSDPACANNVANEVIRYNASNQFTWRLVARPVQIDSARIEEGQLVVPRRGVGWSDYCDWLAWLVSLLASFGASTLLNFTSMSTTPMASTRIE